MLFSGRDIWRNGVFAHGGFVVAPSGFDRDGLLLKVMLSGGLYRYNAQNLAGERVVGAEWLTNILPGGGSSAAMPNSKCLWGQKFKIITCGQTIPPIGCAATHTACASRRRLGMSQPRK